MIPSSVEAKLKNRMDNRLKEMASYKGNLPDTNSAEEIAAGELYLASELKKRADTLLKAARERAVIAGVTIDTETSTFQGKDNKVLFDGEHVIVSVSVHEGATSYPAKDIRAALVSMKMKQEDINLVFGKAEKKAKNAHFFTAALKTDKTTQPAPVGK